MRNFFVVCQFLGILFGKTVLHCAAKEPTAQKRYGAHSERCCGVMCMCVYIRVVDMCGGNMCVCSWWMSLLKAMRNEPNRFDAAGHSARALSLACSLHLSLPLSHCSSDWLEIELSCGHATGHYNICIYVWNWESSRFLSISFGFWFSLYAKCLHKHSIVRFVSQRIFSLLEFYYFIFFFSSFFLCPCCCFSWFVCFFPCIWSVFHAIAVCSIFIDDASCLFPFGLKVIWNGYTHTHTRVMNEFDYIKMLSPMAFLHDVCTIYMKIIEHWWF